MLGARRIKIPEKTNGKLKGSTFYRKMMEDLGRHKSTKFTRKEIVADKALKVSVF